jgi:hypothetical protein
MVVWEVLGCWVRVFEPARSNGNVLIVYPTAVRAVVWNNGRKDVLRVSPDFPNLGDSLPLQVLTRQRYGLNEVRGK